MIFIFPNHPAIQKVILIASLNPVTAFADFPSGRSLVLMKGEGEGRKRTGGQRDLPPVGAPLLSTCEKQAQLLTPAKRTPALHPSLALC